MSVHCRYPAAKFSTIVAALLLSCSSFAQSGVAESQQHLRAASAAYEAGDFRKYTTELETAHKLNPDSLYTRYNLACGYALTGQTEQALAMLTWLTEARVDFNMADDPDLASLADNPRFQQLLARTAVNTRPISNSRHTFTVSRLDLLPEGIAWDPASKRFFFGSMRNGEVFAAASSGQHTLFATVAKDGPLSAIGMTVDTARNLLWVIGTRTTLLDGVASDMPVVSGVFAYALDSGELQHAYTRDDVGFGFNDVTLAPNGDIYLSGDVLGYVPAAGDGLEILETSEPVFGSNGIVVTPDGKTLITSSYPAGVAAIRISDGQTTFLQAPDNVPLYGIDGMYLYEGDLIAVQHGARPWRLMRFALDPSLSRITSARTIEFANENVTATTGAIVGNEIHYIGQGTVPESMPAHIAEHLHKLIGPTIVMTAPLD